MEFLYLSEEDLKKAGVLDVEKCVNVIEEMFKTMGEKDYLMGGPSENSHGEKIWFPKEKRTDNMPTAGFDKRFYSLIAYLGGNFNVTGNKWYGSNPKNREKELPRSILTVTLNDVETGQPLAFMSGNLISAMRTGAVPGVASKYLCSDQTDTLSIVGAGVISWSSVLGIIQGQPKIRNVKIFDISDERATDFKERLEKEHKHLNVITVNSMDECIKGSDIIALAASGKKPPEIKENLLKSGVLIILTAGTDISDELILNSKIITDNWQMHLNTGEQWEQWEEKQSNITEIQNDIYYGIAGQVYRLYKDEKMSDDDITDFGDIISGNKMGRENQNQTIIFIAGGMPTSDIAWAYTLYQEAKNKKLGTSMKLWETPEWL